MVRALSYNTVSLAGVSLNLSILFVLTHFLGLYYLLSEVLAILGAFAFNYITNLNYTWEGTRSGPTAELKLH